jgi:hypothetical protein
MHENPCADSSGSKTVSAPLLARTSKKRKDFYEWRGSARWRGFDGSQHYQGGFFIVFLTVLLA